jgi:hypothetical protein
LRNPDQANALIQRGRGATAAVYRSGARTGPARYA